MKLILYIAIIFFVYSCGKEERTNTNFATKKKIISDTLTHTKTDSNLTNSIIKQSKKKISQPKLKQKPLQKKEKVSIPATINIPDNILDWENSKAPYKIKSISKLWKNYKLTKKKAKYFRSVNQLDSIIIYLTLAAEAAYELNRTDIAAWQLNNIGYYSIIEFKRRTNYDNAMEELKTITNLKQRGLYLAKTRDIIKDNFYILNKTEKYLQKAQLLDMELEDIKRKKIIESNLQFIEWVRNFISDNK